MSNFDWPEGALFLMCTTQNDVHEDAVIEQEAFDSNGNASRVLVGNRRLGGIIRAGTKVMLAHAPGWSAWHIEAAECN